MYKFKRPVSTMTGKVFAVGAVVPENVFNAIEEMIKAGDIEKCEPPVKTKDEPVVEQGEFTEDVPEPVIVERPYRKAGKR